MKHPLRGPNILIWVVGARGRGFFFFFELLMCSYHFSKLLPKFLMCPPRMFPIAPDFKPICFAPNPPLLTYILRVFVAMGISPSEKLWRTLLRRKIHPTNGKCNHALKVPWFFFLLSFGFRVGKLEGRFFFSSCIWCGEWTVHAIFEGGGFFFHFSLFPNVFSRCYL